MYLARSGDARAERDRTRLALAPGLKKTRMSQITKTRATEILQTLRARKVLVLGDVMLDEFVWGDVTRISPEGPVPVVDVRRESVHLGGAANVLANLIALGAHGRVVGVIGNDHAGARVREELRQLNSAGDVGLIVDES